MIFTREPQYAMKHPSYVVWPLHIPLCNSYFTYPLRIWHPMNNFLLSFHKIYEDSPDRSDYDNFETQARAYLAKEPHIHHLYFYSFKKCLKRARSAHLIKLVYSLLASLDLKIAIGQEICCESFIIQEKIILSHLQNDGTWSLVLPLLLKQNVTCFDSLIKRRIFAEDSIFSKGICEYLRCRPNISSEYMDSRFSSYLQNQIALIGTSGIVHNLDYFAVFMGSESKLLSFRTFEAFSTVCINWADASNPVLMRAIGRNKITPEMPARFVSYAFNFMTEKNDIIKALDEKNYEKFSEITTQYCSNNLTLDEFNGLALHYVRRTLPDNAEYSPEADFTFLFNGNSKKQHCDCPEL